MSAPWVSRVAFAIVLAIGAPALAQTPAPADSAPPPRAQATNAQAEKPPLSQAELDQVLAPVALYPDPLLSQIFMASTYPLEVVEADRWVEKNASLKGDALTRALEAQPWDPSVKSLANFPMVLSMMSKEIGWTV